MVFKMVRKLNLSLRRSNRASSWKADERRSSNFCRWTCCIVSVSTLLGALFLYYEETRLPNLLMNRMFDLRCLVFLGNGIPAMHGSVIKATHIKGREEVQQFRDHLGCFSESGKWVYDPEPRHLPWNAVGDAKASECDRRHPGLLSNERAEAIARTGTKMDWSVREELKWAWQTNSSCPFSPVNRDELCKAIGPRRNVMVVGDSINNEISWSLMNHLVPYKPGLTRLSFDTKTTDGVHELCEDILGAGNGFKVSFVRNDRLSPVSTSKADKWKNLWKNFEYPWLNLLSEYDVKLVLLNRGAHYEDDQLYTRALRLIFTILATHFPHLKVIYRNTPPGHVKCQSYNGPLLKRQDGKSLPAEYHWADFYRQNQLAAQIVEEFQYTYMDVDTMLSLRPEAHIAQTDCIHYCLPGPLDLSVQYLYNILLLMKA